MTSGEGHLVSAHWSKRSGGSLQFPRTSSIKEVEHDVAKRIRWLVSFTSGTTGHVGTGSAEG